MPLQNYRDLEVWKVAMDLVVEVYKLTDRFPAKEQFGLSGQIRRAAVSVPSNIAEGYGRDHRGDYRHHLSIASGSLCEMETQLVLAGRLEYVSRDDVRPAWDLSQRVGQMLLKLKCSLKSRKSNPDQPGSDDKAGK